MKRPQTILVTILAAVLLLHSCGRHSQNTVENDKDTVAEESSRGMSAESADNRDTVTPLPEGLADVRRPDMKVRIRKGSALLLETDGFQLTAVDTAVRHAGVYSVTSLLEEELAPLPQGMKNMTAAAAGYRLLPGGEHFSPYAEVRVAYDPERLPLGYTPEDIYTSYYDTASWMWVRLERLEVDTVHREIVSATTHFTDFINELLQSPEMPETQAFVPTALTDLEAVNPLDGLTIIQPPTANNNGTATISYPLVIPAGRGGMQPNLALTYSSTGGSGWLGTGWDIPVPAITLDTRWGVPRYDTTYETEIYMLNGEQLVAKGKDGEILPMPHRTNNQTYRSSLLDDSNRVHFFARTGDAHDSIIRYGDSPKNYWWKVIDRNGVTHFYGRYCDSIRNMPPDTIFPFRRDTNTIFSYEGDTNSLVIGSRKPYVSASVRNLVDRWPYPATLRDDNRNIARWVLTESRDIYGNTVRYYYDRATVRNRGAVGRQIYLDSISYTGYKKDDGHYSVVFCRTGNMTPDVPVSCNNGFKEITDQLLNNVYLKCGDSIQTIWHFETENGDSTNYKNRLTSVTKIDSVENMRMRDLLNSFCHCLKPDEDEFATGDPDAPDNFMPNGGSLVFMPGSDTLILDTVVVYAPKCYTITDKCCIKTSQDLRSHHETIYNHLRTLYPDYDDSLFYAIYDSIYFQVAYDSVNSYGIPSFRVYRYYKGYEQVTRVDSIRVTLLDATSWHSLPLNDLYKDGLKYAGTTTTFDYYNAPDSKSLFSDPEPMYLGSSNANLQRYFMSDKFNLNPLNKATALGLSSSSSWSVSGTAAVGIAPRVYCTSASVGGNYTRSESSSESLMTLVDLDGDGLPDKVYVEDDEVFFCRQIQYGDQIDFAKRVRIDSISHFMEESSYSNTFGVQANLGVSGSANWTKSKSTTSTYFADVNGDGLIDLVRDGQVYFNHLRNMNGQKIPEFSRYRENSSANQQDDGGGTEYVYESATNSSCQDIIFDGKVNDSITCQRVWVLIDTFTAHIRERDYYSWLNENSVDTMYKISQEKENIFVEVYRREWDCSYHDESLNTDAVRVWIAPDSGAVDITSIINLLEDTSASRKAARHADGVVLSVQHTSNISHSDSCFYVGSINKHLMDTMLCDTCYSQVVNVTRRDTVNRGDMIFFRLRSKKDRHFDNIDAHFNIKYKESGAEYDSKKDFVLSSDLFFEAPVNGHCDILGYLDDSTGYAEVYVEWNGSRQSCGSNGILFSQDVSEGDDIRVLLRSDYNIEWGKVVCRPRIIFTPADGAKFDTINSSDNSGDTEDSDNVGISFTNVLRGWLTPKVELPDTCSLYTDTLLYRRLFGPLHNGWGQFAYRSEGADADTIKIEKLIPPDMMVPDNTNDNDRDRMDAMTRVSLRESSFEASETMEEFQKNNPDFYNPHTSSSAWVEMIPDAEHWAWVSFGQQNSIYRDTMSNSVQKEWFLNGESYDPDDDNNEPVTVSQQTTFYDDPVPPEYYDGTPAKVVRKVNRTKSRSWSVGFAQWGGSHSSGDNTIEMDYMDLNGDRYPDIIGTDKVQYSQQWGGIGPLTDLPTTLSHGSTSHTGSDVLSYSASPVMQKRTTCGIQQNGLFTMQSSGCGHNIGASGNIGHDKAGGSWVDMNGDGLADFVYPDGSVKLNIGYGFIDDKRWNFKKVRSGVSGAISFGLDAENSFETMEFLPDNVTNVYQGSIKAGFGINASYNQSTHMLMDINGDGLPDKLWRELNSLEKIIMEGEDAILTKVKYNLGGGRFSGESELDIGRFHSSASFNESIDAGLTYGFTAWVFKITVGASACPYSAGVSQDYVQLADINGDGLPDWVYSNDENTMDVRFNKSGQTNLLKGVTNFTGSSIHLDYELSPASYEQPSRGWLMTRVTTNDPLNPNGGQTSITEYTYDNPYYDRYERMSYGYDSVVTKQIDPVTHDTLRYVEHGYNNRSLMKRGELMRERTYDRNHDLYIEKLKDSWMIDYNTHDTVRDGDCPAIAYPAVEASYTKYYEGSGNTPLLVTGEKFEYDRYHNVSLYTNLGDFADPTDDIVVEMEYYTNQPHNLIGLRKSYKVKPGAGSSVVLREAHFDYTYNKLAHQRIGSGSNAPEYDFKYDDYGNLKGALLPENNIHQRMAYIYTYDSILHTYLDTINNISYGEYTKTIYNDCFGKPTAVTAPSHNTMTYTYDFLGRLASVNSPKNQHVGTPSVVNQYHPVNYYHNNFQPSGYHYVSETHPYSLTKHYDDYGNLITETVVITDGFGRVIQTKKGLTENGNKVMQVSGRAMVDALGRTIEQYDMSVEPETNPRGALVFSPTATLMASTSYDVLDRVVGTVQPLGITTQTKYDIVNRQFYTWTKDPENKITKQYADYAGRQVLVVADADGIQATTKMHYDKLGQLEWSQDPEGFETHYGYDNLGRLKYRDHPDAGYTEYFYDPAGNLTKESNPLGEISYDYTYYRPRYKRYSYMSGNDVTYEYGTTGNDIGRPVFITDGSGSHECHYDKLGNVTEEIRTIALPKNDNEVYRFHMGYEYDSWGRIHTMIYPDGEKVSYEYNNWGGDLIAMYGNNPYIKDIRYNAFGQRDQIIYGNGTYASYTYDALHRLSGLESFEANGTNRMQKIKYTFDHASNITNIFNDVTPFGAFIGGYNNEYNYDGLHRLVNSQGDNMLGQYIMNMDYTPSGRIAHKQYTLPSGALSHPVDMYYGYCDDYQPHAVRRIFDKEGGLLSDFRWDKAGNLGQISFAKPDGYFVGGRFLFWTEDNRMHAAVDEEHYSYYAYDYSGERRLKLTGKSDRLDVNAEFMHTTTPLDNPTLYPSAYLVLTKNEYTKHYYAGADRVAACLGGGEMDLSMMWGDSYTGRLDPQDVQGVSDKLFKQSIKQVGGRVLEPNDLDCIKEIFKGEFDKELHNPIDGIPNRMRANVGFKYYDFRRKVEELRHYQHDEGKYVYYYHSDHLGSASWITNHNGDAVQHIQYLPYGEPYVDKRTSGYSERFRFTGKERDEETGYGYFGARYMDHEQMTMWLSVDPMADKYPNISPYAYCAWNPIKLVDPDGCEIGDYYTRDGKWVGRDKYKDNKVYICDGVDKKGNFINADELKITHSEFRKKAATVYGESSAYRYPGNTVPEDLRCEMFAIASVHERNDKAYGANSQKAKDFLNQTPEQNNSNNFRTTANAAVINAVTGGFDYSYGATQWDGMEQALYPESENRCHVDGYELHMNTMGWKISDEHYSIWKANVGGRFKAPQEKKAVAGKHKGEMGLKSTAVYCRTIFWE